MHCQDQEQIEILYFSSSSWGLLLCQKPLHTLGVSEDSGKQRQDLYDVPSRGIFFIYILTKF